MDLSNNKLGWNELLKLKYVTILDLRVFGNPELSELCVLIVYSLNYFCLDRPILIYLMPYVWSLDGWFISHHERAKAAAWCSLNGKEDV